MVGGFFCGWTWKLGSAMFSADHMLKHLKAQLPKDHRAEYSADTMEYGGKSNIIIFQGYDLTLLFDEFASTQPGWVMKPGVLAAREVQYEKLKAKLILKPSADSAAVAKAVDSVDAITSVAASSVPAPVRSMASSLAPGVLEGVSSLAVGLAGVANMATAAAKTIDVRAVVSVAAAVSIDSELMRLLDGVQGYMIDRHKEHDSDYLNRQRDWGKILFALANASQGLLNSDIARKCFFSTNHYRDHIDLILQHVKKLSSEIIRATVQAFQAKLEIRKSEPAIAITLREISVAASTTAFARVRLGGMVLGVGMASTSAGAGK